MHDTSLVWASLDDNALDAISGGDDEGGFSDMGGDFSGGDFSGGGDAGGDFSGGGDAGGDFSGGGDAGGSVSFGESAASFEQPANEPAAAPSFEAAGQEFAAPSDEWSESAPSMDALSQESPLTETLQEGLPSAGDFQSSSFEANGSEQGWNQLAGLDASDRLPIEVDRTLERFDDGTELETRRYDDGGTGTMSRETDTQTFDDGSRIITTRDAYASGSEYTDIRSQESLEARLESRPLIDDPRTASSDDVQLARDVLDNYDHQLRRDERDGLYDFIDSYYTGRPSSIYGTEPPTPSNIPTIDQKNEAVI